MSILIWKYEVPVPIVFITIWAILSPHSANYSHIEAVFRLSGTWTPSGYAFSLVQSSPWHRQGWPRQEKAVTTSATADQGADTLGQPVSRGCLEKRGWDDLSITGHWEMFLFCSNSQSSSVWVNSGKATVYRLKRSSSTEASESLQCMFVQQLSEQIFRNF